MLSHLQLFCDPMDYSLPGSSVHGIIQVRILAWVVIPFSRGSSQTRDWTWVSCIAGQFFTIWATRETQLCRVKNLILSIFCLLPPPLQIPWSLLAKWTCVLCTKGHNQQSEKVTYEMGENICESCLMGLISRIYKELLQLNNKQQQQQWNATPNQHTHIRMATIRPKTSVGENVETLNPRARFEGM